MTGDDVKVKLPPGIPPEALPDAEFAARIQAIESSQTTPPTPPDVMAAHKKEMEERLAQVENKQAEIESPSPVVLKYIYTGVCDTCKTPVTTLELDVSKTHVVVAHCVPCNKQLQSREEKKLNA